MTLDLTDRRFVDSHVTEADFTAFAEQVAGWKQGHHDTVPVSLGGMLVPIDAGMASLMHAAGTIDGLWTMSCCEDSRGSGRAAISFSEAPGIQLFLDNLELTDEQMGYAERAWRFEVWPNGSSAPGQLLLSSEISFPCGDIPFVEEVLRRTLAADALRRAE